MVWKILPELCQWDITSSCNLRCRHCRAAASWEKEKNLPFAKVISILGQLISFAPDVFLAFAGGEPLARKDLREIISWLKHQKDSTKIALLSNGTLINKSNIGWLAELVNEFNISLEGASAEVNDFVRGDGSFSKALKGISLLVRHSVPVTVRMTFFRQKESEVESLMKFLPGIGVNSFNFRYVVPVGRAQGFAVSALQYERLCQTIWRLGKELGIEAGFSDPFPEILLNKNLRKEMKKDKELMLGKAVTGCSIAFNLLYIDPQGIVKACPYFPVVCDDAKAKPLAEIWFKNEVLQSMRTVRGAIGGKCGKCEYKFACGGCRGAALAKGDFLGEDSRCWKQ